MTISPRARLAVSLALSLPLACSSGEQAESKKKVAPDSEVEKAEAARKASETASAEERVQTTAAFSRASGTSVTSDFLTQDVCITPSGAVTNIDPYDCPADHTRRDLIPGEFLTYHRISQEGGQIGNSYPVAHLGPNGVVFRYVNAFDFMGSELDGTPVARMAFKEFNYWTDEDRTDGILPPRNASDGLDLGVEIVPGLWNAYGGSIDPGGDGPVWDYGSRATPVGPTRLGGWALFPEGLAPGGRATILTYLASAKGKTWDEPFFTAPPAERASGSYTVADYYAAPLTYTGDKNRTKALESIVSWHFGGNDIASANHIEKFFYTRLYGKTRWERWQNTSNSNSEKMCNGNVCTPASQPAATGCVGSHEEVLAGQRFIMISCRDWTRVESDELPGWNPKSAYLPRNYGSGNWLRNGDFGLGTNFVEPWQRQGEMYWGIREAPATGPVLGHYNHFMSLAGLPAASVYQDVPVALAGHSDVVTPTPGTMFELGGTFWTEGGEVPVHVRLFQLDAADAIVPVPADWAAANPAPIDLTARPGKQMLNAQTWLLPGAVKLRFQVTVLVDSRATPVLVDDLYVAMPGAHR